jgi:hypothetical protein
MEQKQLLVLYSKTISTSMKENEEEEGGDDARKQQSFQDYLIISPTKSIFYSPFKSFVVLLCILSSFLYAYFAAFRYDVDGGEINKLKSGYTSQQIKYFNAA